MPNNIMFGIERKVWLSHFLISLKSKPKGPTSCVRDVYCILYHCETVAIMKVCTSEDENYMNSGDDSKERWTLWNILLITD